MKNALLFNILNRQLTPFEAYYLKFKNSTESEYPLSEFYKDVAKAYNIPDDRNMQMIINNAIWNRHTPLEVHTHLRNICLQQPVPNDLYAHGGTE